MIHKFWGGGGLVEREVWSVVSCRVVSCWICLTQGNGRCSVGRGNKVGGVVYLRCSCEAVVRERNMGT